MEGGRWMFNCFASLFAQSRWRNAHQMAGFSLAGSSKLPSASEKNRVWKKLDYAWKGDCFSWVSEGYRILSIHVSIFSPRFWIMHHQTWTSALTWLDFQRILAMIRIGWPVAAPETLGWCTTATFYFWGWPGFAPRPQPEELVHEVGFGWGWGGGWRCEKSSCPVDLCRGFCSFYPFLLGFSWPIWGNSVAVKQPVIKGMGYQWISVFFELTWELKLVDSCLYHPKG